MSEGRMPNAADLHEIIRRQAAKLAELHEALELADATLRGANMNRGLVERKVAAALSRGPKGTAHD